MASDVTWQWCLGNNLAMIGFGFAAFRAGDQFGFHMSEDNSQCTCRWSPGKGVPYDTKIVCPQDKFEDPNCQRCDDYGCRQCDPFEAVFP